MLYEKGILKSVYSKTIEYKDGNTSQRFFIQIESKNDNGSYNNEIYGIGKKLVDEKDFIENLKEYEGKEVLIPVFRIENLKSYDRNNQKHYFIDKARFVAGLPE